jgi:hypothetical protein
MSVVVEDIPIGFTGQVYIIVMIPVDTCWSVVVELVLVTQFELVGKFLSRDAHESIFVGEFPFGESDGISFIIVFFSTNDYIGLILEILHEYLRSSLCEIIFESRIGENLVGEEYWSGGGSIVIYCGSSFVIEILDFIGGENAVICTNSFKDS